MDGEDYVVYFVTRETAEEDIVWAAGNPKPFHVVFTCRRGKVSIPLQRGVSELEPGDTVFFRADRLRGHVMAREMPMEHEWASFYSPAADRLPPRNVETDPGTIRVLFDRLLSAFGRSGGQSRPATFWMQALVRAVLEDHGPQEAQRSGRAENVVRSVIQQIDAHPELFWSVADLAARAGYSETHFCRTFKALTDMSPQQYLIDARISRAQVLLRTTDLTISQVADALGYQEVYHFSKQFKRRTGRPPSECREPEQRDA
jgi:AraC-like DNA-binding protein